MLTQHHPTPAKNYGLALALAAGTLALAACGGGGGGSGDGDDGIDPPAPVVVNPALAMQGFWSGPLTAAPDGATRSSAVVMPDGTGWIVFESNTAPTAVARLGLTGTGVNETDATAAGSGNYYPLGTTIRGAVTATGTASTRGTFTGNLTVSGNPTSTFNWAASAGFTTPSVAADVVGTWNGTLGGSAVLVSWQISSSGALTGNSSLGCTYAGTLRPSTGTAVYDLSVVETCGGGAVRNMSGIAMLAGTSAATPKNSLRVVFTADAGTSGGLFALTKQ